MDPAGPDVPVIAREELLDLDRPVVVLEGQAQRPAVTRIDSSLTSWRWSDSRLPASMTSTFPTYVSVCAQMSSWPHGLSTRRAGAVRPVAHEPRTSRSPATSSASRSSAEVASV